MPRHKTSVRTLHRARLEQLEDRTVPSTFSWNLNANGNWNNPANWSLVSGPPTVSMYPDASDDVARFLGAISANRTITIPDGESITVNDLQFDDNNNYTIAAAGSGSLAFSGGGISLSVGNAGGNGAHTISAPTTLNGTLQVTNDSSGVLTLSGALRERTFPLPIIAGGLTMDGTGTVRLSGAEANTFTLPTTVVNGTLELSKTAGVNAFGGNLVVGDGSGGGATAVVRHLQSNNIPTAATVTVNADGFYILNGQSDTIGPLIVTDGIVFVDAGRVSFTALTMTGGTITSTGVGEVSFAGNATINASANGSTIDGSGHVTIDGLAIRTFTVADGAALIDLNISSAVEDGVFANGLTKDGPGTMRLGGAGTFAGTTLNAGTLLVGNNTALGASGVVITGGTLQADGAARTLTNPVTISGDFTVAGSLDLSFNGAATLTGNRTINVTNTGLTSFGGAVGQNAAGRSLTKAGAGTLRLSGAGNNTYSGLTTVADGVLELNKTPAITAFAGNLLVGDGTGGPNSAVARHVQSNNIPLAATATVNADGLYDLNGQNEDFGPLVINDGNVTVGAGLISISDLTMTDGSLSATGAGLIDLFGNVTTNAAATAANISGSLDLNGANRTFTVADGSGGNTDLDLSAIVSDGALTKAGPGTLRLTGTQSNIYSGQTTVSAGTLELNKTAAVAVPADLTINGGVVRELASDQIANTAVINVNAGGTFDLNGQSDTVGVVTVTGGTVTTSGIAAGRLTAGNTSFNAAATLAEKLVGATTSDQITVIGAVTVGGALQLNLASAVAPGTVITLIDNDLTDAVAGTFTGLPQGSVVVVGGQIFTISYTGGTGNDVVLIRSDSLRVTDTQVNGGATQRSRVTDLAVTFSGQVNFLTTPGAAFTLVRNSDMAAVTFSATAIVVGGVTVVTFNNFGGAATQSLSLADGRYTLTALASQISAGGQALDGNGNGTPGDNYTFGDAQGLYRFYGDTNGDRRVDISDFGFFSVAFLSTPNYNPALDFNNDGRIDITDFGQFSVRFFTNLP